MNLAPLSAGLETERPNHKWWCNIVGLSAVAERPASEALWLHSIPRSSPETVKGILYLVRNCHILMKFCNGAIKCQRKKERQLGLPL